MSADEASRKNAQPGTREKKLRAADRRNAKLRQSLPKNLSWLVDEIDNYQSELESQNEQLRDLNSQLEQSQRDFADLYDFAPVGYFVFNRKGVIKSVNRAGSNMLRWKINLLVGTPFSSFVFKDDLHIFLKHLIDAFSKKTEQTAELRIVRADKSILHARLLTLIVESGVGTCRTAIVDITDLKEAEERLTGLLKELHHRVKNNLQVISSLLALQSAKTTNSDVVSAFRESRNRIKSMALVHEHLYHSRDLNRVDLKTYLVQLVKHVRDSYSAEAVSVSIEADECALAIDLAIPCGLILNELLTNSLVHAFVGRSKGNISVELRSGGQGDFQLTVHDDGVGLEQDVDAGKYETLGLRLVEMLAKQINATLAVETGQGTNITLTFRAPEA